MDEGTIKKVARIARLRLTEEEEKAFSKDLGNILDSFKVLQKVNSNERPAYHPVEIKNIMREDKIIKGLSQEDALANAGQKEKGYFKGPKAIG